MASLFHLPTNLLQSVCLPKLVECISGKVQCGKLCVNILNTYCPPDSPHTFFSGFQDMLSYSVSLPHNLVLMEDFNLHIGTCREMLDSSLIFWSRRLDLDLQLHIPTTFWTHSDQAIIM